jgi:hypothetical protein
MNPRNLFTELKRRNVYKVAVAYATVEWLVDADRQYWLSKGVFVRRVCPALVWVCSDSRVR